MPSHLINIKPSRSGKFILPIPRRPRRKVKHLVSVHKQARIQLKGRTTRQPSYEFIDIQPQRGFLRLPEPNDGDIFFDIEGNVHAVRQRTRRLVKAFQKAMVCWAVRQ
jgi:hypothetical protein